MRVLPFQKIDPTEITIFKKRSQISYYKQKDAGNHPRNQPTIMYISWTQKKNTVPIVFDGKTISGKVILHIYFFAGVIASVAFPMSASQRLNHAKWINYIYIYPINILIY